MKAKFTLLALLFAGFLNSNAQQMPNGSYEVWINTYNPDKWITWDGMFQFNLGFTFRDTIDYVATVGTTSIKLVSDSTVLSPQSGVIPGMVSLGTGSYSPPNQPSFSGAPFNGRPDTLFYYYKYTTPGVDTAYVVVSLTMGGAPVMGAMKHLPVSALWVSDYVLLTPNYINGNTPDTLLIQFWGSTGNHVQFSTLHVDGVRFGYATLQATASASGNTVFCQGGSVTLNAGTGVNYTYQWYNGANPITGATDSSYVATTTGNYTVWITSGGNTSISNSITVTVNPVPVGTVTFLGTAFGYALLQGGPSGATYQWLKQTIITGPYINTGVTTQLDTVPCAPAAYYSVVVTQNGCVDTSAAYAVICSGIEEITSLQHFSIQPNPANDVLHVAYELSAATPVRISLVDLSGRKVMDVLNETEIKGQHAHSVNINGLSSGIYMLNFMSETGSFNSKFVKQ